MCMLLCSLDECMQFTAISECAKEASPPLHSFAQFCSGITFPTSYNSTGRFQVFCVLLSSGHWSSITPRLPVSILRPDTGLCSRGPEPVALPSSAASLITDSQHLLPVRNTNHMDSSSSSSASLIAAAAVCGGLLGWILRWLYERRFNRKLSSPAKASVPLAPALKTAESAETHLVKLEEEFVHVMTFPTSPRPCASIEMYGKCTKTHCPNDHGESHSQRIRKYLSEAKTTVDIAAQGITSHQIADVLENLAKRGVRVRIIRDYDNLSLLKGTEKISALQKVGVQFKVNGKKDPKDPKSLFVAGIFHHKFMIVDSKVLIHGSGNFTLKAVLQNYECAVATNLPDLVGKYQEHFNGCWDTFDNAIIQ